MHRHKGATAERSGGAHHFTPHSIVILQAKAEFKSVRREAIRLVERTAWLSRQTKSRVMQKLATTKATHSNIDNENGVSNIYKT